MTAALFFSGGKDSAWCLTRIDGPVEMVTTIGPDGRVPIQGIRREVIEAQAEALGLRLTVVALPARCDNQTYVARIGEAVAERSFDRLVFGDLFLADIRAFREQAFGELGAALEFPLWGCDTRNLLQEMLAGGLRARICSVAADRLEPAHLGRVLDEAWLADLPAEIDACGENGEFHTVVEQLPPMPDPLALREGSRFERDDHWILDYRL